MTKVKICCISSIDEAKMAISAGATELGMVGPMPSGPGVISLNEMKAIMRTIPAHINTFLLTSETTAEGILHQHRIVNTNTIQIVDAVEKNIYTTLRQEIPEVKLVQVIHVIGENSVTEAQKLDSEVDYILLDSGNPDKAIKELGGTGRTHNWDISRSIVQSVNSPVFLAGGLSATNVRKAVDYVNPYGVDLCSGVRHNNKLDSSLLSTFFSELQT